MQKNCSIGVRITTNDNEKVQSYNGDNQSLQKLILLRNQLASHHTSSKYTIQEIIRTKDGTLKIGDNLVGYPIVIDFEGDKPVFQNEQQKKDFELLVQMFSNPAVMRTSSINNGKPLEGKQLLQYIKQVTSKNDSTDFLHGMYRIYDVSKGHDIGVQGMVDIGLRSIYDKDKVVESLTFLKEEFLRKGYGRTLIDSFFRYFENTLGDHIVYTIKYDNPMTHKICTEHVPIHIGMIRDKEENGKGWTNLFTVDYEFAKRKVYIQEKVLPIFQQKLNQDSMSNVEKFKRKKQQETDESKLKL